MTKKHLGLVLRLLMALAGVAYIVYVVDWTDKIELPAGQYVVVVASGETQISLPKTQTFRVTSGDFDPAAPKGVLTCQIVGVNGSPLGEFRIRAKTLKPSPEPGVDVRLRPGLLTTLRHAKTKLLWLGLLIAGPLYLLAAYRWWLLLRARKLEVPLWEVFKLSMVGCFFNYCLPGSTGGDFIRAFYVAKIKASRSDAVMTVIVDRVVGLVGLMILAGAVGVFVTNPRIHPAMVLIWSLSGATVFFSSIYFSRRLRRLVGLDWLIGKLAKPGSFLASVEAAASAYRDHKMVIVITILVSLGVHFLIALAGAVAGKALGMQTSIGLMLAVIPVLILVAAIPISYQGFGFMEVLGIRLLAVPGLANANQVIVMLLLIRLYQVLYSLLGAAYMMRGNIRIHPQEQEKELEEKPTASQDLAEASQA